MDSGAGSSDAAAARERLTDHLLGLGASREEIDEAIAAGTLQAMVPNYALFGRLPNMSMTDVANQLGVSVEKVRRVALAAGFAFDVDDKVFVPDDVQMFTSFVEGSAFFEPYLLLRYSRMLG